MEGLMNAACTYTPQYTIFNRWLIAAGLLFCATTILLSEQYVTGPAAYALAAATIVVFAIAGRAYVQFLRSSDELIRKIHLEALATAFGASAFFMLGWRLCERLGAPKLDVDDPFMVMIVVWAVSQALATRRYAGDAE
jgi:hypothetical protein